MNAANWIAREWERNAKTTVGIADPTARVSFTAIAECTTEDDAATIVRCVNAHNDLLAALKSLVAMYDADDMTGDGWEMLFNVARAAIAKAEGR